MGQKSNPIILRIGKNQVWKSKYFEKKNAEEAKYVYKNLEIELFIQKHFKNYGLILHTCNIQQKSSSLEIFISYYLSFKLTTFQLSQKKNFYYKKSANIHNSVFYNSNRYLEYIDLKFKRYTKMTDLSEKTLYNNSKILSIGECTFKSKHLIENVMFIKKLTESLSIFFGYKMNISLIFEQLNKSISYSKQTVELSTRKFLHFRRYHKEDFFLDSINIFRICISHTDSAKLLSEFIAFQLKKQSRKSNLFLRFLKNLLSNVQTIKFSILKGIQVKISGRFNKIPRAKVLLLKAGQVPIINLSSKISYHETVSYSQNGTLGVKVWLIEKP